MTPEGILAIGIIVGLALGLTWGYTTWGHTAKQHSLDLDQAEQHIRRLEKDNEFRQFWETEAQRLRRQHAGTPYINTEPGVRDGLFSSAWLDDKDAA